VAAGTSAAALDALSDAPRAALRSHAAADLTFAGLNAERRANTAATDANTAALDRNTAAYAKRQPWTEH
jgi:hypothetical protein